MAGSVVLLALLSVSLADAAPRRGLSKPICYSQTPVARKLAHHRKSFGGPLRRPPSHAMAGLQDVTARMLRGRRADLGNSAAVIQNDTPATGTDADDCLVPSLRPFEIVGSLNVQSRSRAFSPRSPRGPPLSA